MDSATAAALQDLQTQIRDLQSRPVPPNPLVGLAGGLLGGVLGSVVSPAVPGPAGPQGLRGRDGGPGPTGAQGPIGPAGPEGPAFPMFTGRFFDETATQNIFVEPVTGNDVTGDGLTVPTAYQTVARALRDLPIGWSADVDIILPAGTVAGNQQWVLSVLPGPKTISTTTTGRVQVRGDATPIEVLTGGVAGVPVAGRSAAVDYAVGPYVSVVGNGTHFVIIPQVTFGFAGFIPEASVSPNLRLNTGATTALVNPQLATWTTIFSGTISISCPPFAGDVAGIFAVTAIRFNVSPTIRDVTMRVCRYDTSATTFDVAHNSCVGMAGTLTVGGSRQVMTSFTRHLQVAGSISITGGCRVGTHFAVAILGAPAGIGKLMLGVVGGQAGQGALISSHQQCDYLGTGDGIVARGGTINFATGASAGGTWAVTGRAILAQLNSKLGALTLTNLTGTAGLASQLNYSSTLISQAGFAVANTVTPGQDIIVGELPVQALAVRPTTSPIELAQYS